MRILGLGASVPDVAMTKAAGEGTQCSRTPCTDTAAELRPFSFGVFLS